MIVIAVLSSIASGLGMYLVVSAYFFVRYYLRRQSESAEWKCQPERWPNWRSVRRDLLLGTFNLLWASTLSALFIHYVVGGGYTALYFSAGKRGIAWLVGSTIAYYLTVDFSLYWLHRTFHHPRLFRWFHCWHHRNTAPTALTSPSVHPFEYLTYQVATALPLFFLPLYAGAVMVTLLCNFTAGLLQHSGVRIYLGIPLVPGSLFHDDHHKYFHVNYGLTFSMWDRMYGTLRREGRRYGIEVFGGRGAATDDGGAAPRFIDYHRS